MMGLLSILSLSLSSSLSLYLSLCVSLSLSLTSLMSNIFPIMHNMLGLTWFCDDLKAPDWKCWSDDGQTNRQTDRISTFRLDPSGRRGRVKITPKYRSTLQTLTLEILPNFYLILFFICWHYAISFWDFKTHRNGHNHRHCHSQNFENIFFLRGNWDWVV